MQCIAVTRGGIGDFWLFDGLMAADEHALVQYGDAICVGPHNIARLWSNLELVRIAKRLGDERLASEVEGKKKVTEYSDRLWNLMISRAKRPPSDPAEILRIVAEDRKKTRIGGVQMRRHPTEESTMDDQTNTTSAEAETKAKKTRAPKTPKEPGEATTTRAPTRAPKYSPDSVISFGADANGKKYGPQEDGSFYNAKRAGSGAAERFTYYKDGQTVQEALDAGVTRGDLNWDADLKQGFIKIT